MEHDPAKPAISPTSLSVADAARLLSKVSGQTVTVGMIQSDMDKGAPTNPDGTIHLVHYGAWLLKEMHHGQ